MHWKPFCQPSVFSSLKQLYNVKHDHSIPLFLGHCTKRYSNWFVLTHEILYYVANIWTENFPFTINFSLMNSTPTSYMCWLQLEWTFPNPLWVHLEWHLPQPYLTCTSSIPPISYSLGETKLSASNLRIIHVKPTNTHRPPLTTMVDLYNGADT